jgi:hypothetical protein
VKKEFKFPCAVETDNLVGNQGNELQEAFIRLGASCVMMCNLHGTTTGLTMQERHCRFHTPREFRRGRMRK